MRRVCGWVLEGGRNGGREGGRVKDTRKGSHTHIFSLLHFPLSHTRRGKDEESGTCLSPSLQLQQSFTVLLPLTLDGDEEEKEEGREGGSKRRQQRKQQQQQQQQQQHGISYPSLNACPLTSSSTLLLPPSLPPSLLPFPTEGFNIQIEEEEEEGREGGREAGQYVTVDRSKGQEGLREGVMRTWLWNHHPTERLQATVRKEGGREGGMEGMTKIERSSSNSTHLTLYVILIILPPFLPPSLLRSWKPSPTSSLPPFLTPSTSRPGPPTPPLPPSRPPSSPSPGNQAPTRSPPSSPTPSPSLPPSLPPSLLPFGLLAVFPSLFGL